MKVHIVLDNFQQTKHAELTFGEGLSIIRGLNNNGKSSLIRAINAVVFNNSRKTKSYIMNGATYCSVQIKVEGYKNILWKKTAKEVIYQIGDDIPIEKAGRLTLKDVYPEHPFTLYEDSLLFNVIAQKARPIPFGQTSSQVFAIFEELYGILSTKEDIDKFNTQLSIYNSQLSQNKQHLENLHGKKLGLLQFKKSIDTTKLSTLKAKMQKAQKSLNTIEEIKKLYEITQAYKITPVPIEYQELQKTISTLRKIKEIKSVKNTLNLKPNLKTPIATDLFKLFSKLTEVKTISEKINSLNKQRATTLDKIKNLKDTLPICPTCKRPF